MSEEQMEYAIELEGLSKRYGAHEAVSDLTLRAPAGKVFAFLGPNGAGKTTTIKSFMNLVRPTAGRARVLGEDSTRLSNRHFERIGYVSENQDMPENLRVGEFLGLCKKLYPRWDDSFQERLMKDFDLPATRRLSELSRGMRMKAALLSSLAYRPELLVLDEPFSGLDPLVREEFVKGVLSLCETERWTIFVSSHDIEEVERLADWIGIIHEGRLVLSESTESLAARFRRLSLALDAPLDTPPPPDAVWMDYKLDGRFVSFVHPDYRPEASENEIRQRFGNIAGDVAATRMTLREIFIAVARRHNMERQLENLA